MSWSGLASNQLVSRNNLQDAVNNGVFTLKNSIPADTKLITTSEAEYYVNINSIGKASNRLVVKSDLVASGPTVYTWYISVGQAAGYLACGMYGSYPLTVYSDNPSFLSYARFYTDPSFLYEFDGFGYWYQDSTFENGTVIQIGPAGETFAQFGC
jgi:hypothetical protein